MSLRRKDVRDYDEDMAPRSVDGSESGKRGNSVRVISNESNGQKGNVARSFSFKELALATRNFREANLIGEGGFGSVYKGRLESGLIVAVKQLNLEGPSRESRIHSGGSYVEFAAPSEPRELDWVLY